MQVFKITIHLAIFPILTVAPKEPLIRSISSPWRKPGSRGIGLKLHLFAGNDAKEKFELTVRFEPPANSKRRNA